MQGFLQSLRRLTHASTRVIIVYYNFAWKPILRLAELAGLKSTEPLQSWLSVAELENVLQLAGFEPVNSGYRTPVPVGPTPLTAPINTLLSAVPLVNRLGLISFVSARPLPAASIPRVDDPTCTVVIPTRNERGNIRAAVERFRNSVVTRR